MYTLDLEQPAKAIQQASANFQNSHDVNQLLCDVRTTLIHLVEELIVSIVQQLLSDQHFLATLKVLAGKTAIILGYRIWALSTVAAES